VSHPAGLHTLGEVRTLTGLSDRRIRYYEQQGLLQPVRSAGHQRLFTAADVARLQEIKRLLDKGLSLKQVRDHLNSPQPEWEEPEGGDAPSYFRGIEWVRRGPASHASPLARHPDVIRHIDYDKE
jgi:DNA-binding transcriptional MerR regulator